MPLKVLSGSLNVAEGKNLLAVVHEDGRFWGDLDTQLMAINATQMVEAVAERWRLSGPTPTGQTQMVFGYSFQHGGLFNNLIYVVHQPKAGIAFSDTIAALLESATRTEMGSAIFPLSTLEDPYYWPGNQVTMTMAIVRRVSQYLTEVDPSLDLTLLLPIQAGFITRLIQHMLGNE